MATSVIVEPQGAPVQTEPDTTELSNEERERIITQLTKPFPLSDIHWMLVEKSDDERSGRMVPYVKRAIMMNRLNSVLGIGKWKKSYPRQETLNITRTDPSGSEIKRSRTSITIRLALPGIGETEENGEEWADTQNATTCADAQAFKRACKYFGIGAYLDGLCATVSLDSQGRPTSEPTIPTEFLPNFDKTSVIGRGHIKGNRPPTPDPRVQPPGAAPRHQPKPQMRRTDKWALEDKVRAYKQTLGQALYDSIVQPIKQNRKSSITAVTIIMRLTVALDAAVADLARIRDAVANTPRNAIDDAMDSLGVESLLEIPSTDVLGSLLRALKQARTGNHTRCRNFTAPQNAGARCFNAIRTLRQRPTCHAG